MNQPRFANGVYRDCKWCGGFDTSKLGTAGLHNLLNKLIGTDAVSAAETEAGKRAAAIVDNNPLIAQIANCSPAEAVSALTRKLTQEVLHENIVKLGNEAVDAQREREE